MVLVQHLRRKYAIRLWHRRIAIREHLWRCSTL
jgi:hypothetical protein